MDLSETVGLYPQAFTYEVWQVNEARSNDEEDIRVKIVENAPFGEISYAGYSAYIPMMPFNSQFSHSISVSNLSTSARSIDLLVHTTDSTPELFEDFALVSAGGVTELGQQIRQLIQDMGIEGQISLTLLSAGAADSLAVTALYYDRLSGDSVFPPKNRSSDK